MEYVVYGGGVLVGVNRLRHVTVHTTPRADVNIQYSVQ